MMSLRNANDKAALENAVRENDLVIVDFYTQACVICKKLEPMLSVIGERFAGKVAVIKVDAEQNLQTATEYNVRGVPTLVLVRNGQEQARRSGFSTTSMLNDWITPFLAK